MKSLDERLKIVEEHVNDDKITIMIIGLGSVGTYLLDFLVSKNDPAIKLVVVGKGNSTPERNDRIEYAIESAELEISALEETFDIMMDTDDIIDFNSFEKGKEILSKDEYGVIF